MVVGSMVGAGIFSLPQTFGRVTGVVGALIAWAIAGVGMLMLALVFQNLGTTQTRSRRRCLCLCESRVRQLLGLPVCARLLGRKLHRQCVVFRADQVDPWRVLSCLRRWQYAIQAVVVSSVILWTFHFLILRGVKQAAVLNTIATVAKLIPIFIFIIILAFNFNSDIFRANLWGGGGYRPRRPLRPGPRHDAGHRVRLPGN